MRFKSFIEMALKNYRLGPFDDDENFYARKINARDEKVVSHSKTYRQLERVLKTSTNFDFNIIIGQPPASKYGYSQNGVRQFVKDIAAKENIPLQNHITFVKSSSTGDVLTSWMILHNIGHAILDNDNQVGNQAMITISKLLSQLETRTNANEKSRVADLVKLFNFRSAREKPNKIIDIGELVFELMAEYLWHGKIRFSESNPIIQEIEKELHNSLAAAVGTIVLDGA